MEGKLNELVGAVVDGKVEEVDPKPLVVAPKGEGVVAGAPKGEGALEGNEKAFVVGVG